MKILAIDTSTSHSSLAVIDRNNILGSFSINQVRSHSETLVPMLDALLKYLNLEIKDLDAYVVGKGPGSFTGLRIGMTIGKTIAQVEKKDIIGISTLKALASYIDTNHYIVPLIDARGGRVYTGVYTWVGKKLINIVEDKLIYIEDLNKMLDSKKDYIFTGKVSEIYREELLTYGKISKFTNEENLAPALARLGEEEYLAGKISEYETLVPKYIRPSQAERDFKNRK